MKLKSQTRSFLLLSSWIITTIIFTFRNKIDSFISTSNQQKFENSKYVPKSYFSDLSYSRIELPENLEVSTLSATFLNTTYRNFIILLVALITIILIYALKVKITSAINILCLTLFGSYFSLLQVDELPDEAYVWAEKVENFTQNGHLGVRLFDGTYGESSVGFLQFALATIPRFLGFTLEQSIFIPLWVGISISQVLIFVLLFSVTRSRVVASITVLAITLNPVFLGNFRFAFDNVLAFSFLIIWSFIELSESVTKKRSFRLFLAVIFPIVRLDYVLVTFAILFLHVFDSKIYNKKELIRDFKLHKKQNFIGLSVFMIFILYKLWAFNDLIPAMARYKSFHYSLPLHIKGLHHVNDALHLTEILTLPFALIVVALNLLILIKNIKSKRYFDDEDRLKFDSEIKIKILLGINLLLILANVLFEIMSGGDYFGPNLVRYELPFLLNFALLFIVYFRLKSRNIHSPNLLNLMIRVSSVSLFFSLVFLILFNPIETKDMLRKMGKIEFGRTTCDAGAALAVKRVFPNFEVVASPEVNGFTFHMEGRVVDLIGLVDPRVDFAGSMGENSLHKFQVIPTESMLDSADVLWLFPGSECTKDPTWFSDKNEENSDILYQQRRLSELVNGQLGRFRIYNFDEYLLRGFKPKVIYYSFYSESIKHYGQAYFFAKE